MYKASFAGAPTALCCSAVRVVCIRLRESKAKSTVVIFNSSFWVRLCGEAPVFYRDFSNLRELLSVNKASKIREFGGQSLTLSAQIPRRRSERYQKVAILYA